MNNKQLRNYLILMVAVIVGVLFLYYIVSPYQNCMRDIQSDYSEGYEKTTCSLRTDW